MIARDLGPFVTVAEPEPSFLASRAARVTLVMSCLYSATGITLVFLPRWLAGERGRLFNGAGALALQHEKRKKASADLASG